MKKKKVEKEGWRKKERGRFWKVESRGKKRERIGIYGIRVWWKKIKRKKKEKKKKRMDDKNKERKNNIKKEMTI